MRLFEPVVDIYRDLQICGKMKKPLIILCALFGLFHYGDANCDGSETVLTATSSGGYILSPNYPDNYPASALCKWKVEGPPGSKISLELLRFTLEDHDLCWRDNLKLFDDAKLLVKLCGTHDVETYTTTTNVAKLKFKSNKRTSFSGFMIKYTVVTESEGSGEVLKNPDFEEDFNGQDNWWCNQCTLTKSSEAHSEYQSAFVSKRTQTWSSITQYIDLEPGKNYYFTAFVRISSLEPGYMYHKISASIKVKYTNGEAENIWLGSYPYLTPDLGWHLIGSDFTAPTGDIESTRIYLSFSESANIDFQLDSVSMKKVPENPSWKEEADARIEQLRKTDFIINTSMNAECNPNDVSIEVKMTKNNYPFGSVVKADWISGTDEDELKYQQVFYENFNWAVIENALKWKQMEWNKDVINFDRPDDALAALAANGIPVRGHAVFWGASADKNPNWFNDLPDSEVQTELDRRIDYMLDHYSGKCQHWDINNEQIHGDVYATRTGNPNITDDFFRKWREGEDPDVLLFLNDYAVIRDGKATLSYMLSAKRMKQSGVPVDAMGLQGHFNGRPDIDQVMFRLDTLAKAGLPLWVTELDIDQVSDVNQLAEGLDDILRVLYSRPEVDGVLLWGFWDQIMTKANASLFNGADLTPNAAGETWRRLVNEEWRTNLQINPNSLNFEQTVRGFRGDYEANVKYKGVNVQTMTFNVGNTPKTVDISVTCQD